MNCCTLLLIAEISIERKDRAALYRSSINIFGELHEGLCVLVTQDGLQLLNGLLIWQHQVVLHHLIVGFYFLKLVND